MMKDDNDWESTNILSLLPDGNDVTRSELNAKMDDLDTSFLDSLHKLPKSEFGSYEPSTFANKSKRTPIAGRRKSGFPPTYPSPLKSWESDLHDASISKANFPPTTTTTNGLSVMRNEEELTTDDVKKVLATPPKASMISFKSLPLDRHHVGGNDFGKLSSSYNDWDDSSKARGDYYFNFYSFEIYYRNSIFKGLLRTITKETCEQQPSKDHISVHFEFVLKL